MTSVSGDNTGVMWNKATRTVVKNTIIARLWEYVRNVLIRRKPPKTLRNKKGMRRGGSQ
jgi:hypothetical protein